MKDTFFYFFSIFSLVVYFMSLCFNIFMLYIKENRKASFFKLFFMPALASFYFFSFKNHQILIYLAIFSLFLGDLFLTKLRLRNIIEGFFFYTLSSLFFFINIFLKVDFKKLNYILGIFVFLFYLSLSIGFIFLTIDRTKKVLKESNIFSIFRVVLSLFCIFVIFFTSHTNSKVFYLIVGSNLLFLTGLIYSHACISKKNNYLDIVLNISYAFSLFFLILGFSKLYV